MITDDGPAVLEHVVRPVDGNIYYKTCKRNTKTKELEFEEKVMENPVIIFFYRGSTTVMEGKEAEAKGFMEQPTILNFDAVQDNNSNAGKFKFAMNMKTRASAWMEMENQIIQKCISKHGHPLPLDVTYSTNSMYLEQEQA